LLRADHARRDHHKAISPTGVLPFVAAQIVGALAAIALAGWLWPDADVSR
jgi:hypothetical protein